MLFSRSIQVTLKRKGPNQKEKVMLHCSNHKIKAKWRGKYNMRNKPFFRIGFGLVVPSSKVRLLGLSHVRTKQKQRLSFTVIQLTCGSCR